MDSQTNQAQPPPSLLKLPPELRIIIWRTALDQAVRPALFPYKKGCWMCGEILPAEWESDDTNPDPDIIVGFCYKLLGQGQLNVPVASVNTEARCVAIEWARKQAHQQAHRIHYHTTESGARFLRSFDPDHDALYVTKETWSDFPIDHSYPGFDHLHDKSYFPRPRITKVAISESTLQDVADQMDALWDEYFTVRKLYIVKDAPRDQLVDHTTVAPDVVYPRLRECESLHKVATWSCCDGDWQFDFTHDLCCDDEFRKLVESASRSLGGIFDWSISKFEIYRAILVKDC
ncbi:hypothetical protein F5Y18DRAFT_368360 [Xylariaceae sp. FL1019]|nr:hypothetical protein F5Y18DRAFT_368360 [Xylariaceae sp. FL1019]